MGFESNINFSFVQKCGYELITNDARLEYMIVLLSLFLIAEIFFNHSETGHKVVRKLQGYYSRRQAKSEVV